MGRKLISGSGGEEVLALADVDGDGKQKLFFAVSSCFPVLPSGFMSVGPVHKEREGVINAKT